MNMIFKKSAPTKTCLIYGNCQAAAIRTYLQKNATFASTYRMIDIKPVHLLTKSDIPYIDQVIAETDLLIYQPVSDDYKGVYQLSTRYLKDHLKSGCQQISFPVAYFTGYNPEVTYLKDINGSQITKPFIYHDINILDLFDQGKSSREILEIIQDDDFYTLFSAEKQFNDTLDSLKLREAGLDIQLSEFVKNNFGKERLLHVFNHPNKTILSLIASSMLEHLGINDRHIRIGPNADILSKNAFPIYPSLIKHLNIQFPCDFVYRFENKVYSAEETVQLFTDFYAENREMVRYNIKKISN